MAIHFVRLAIRVLGFVIICHFAAGFVEVGIYSTLSSTQTAVGSQWTEISNWRTTGNPGLANMQGGAFNTRFMTPIAGTYSVSATLLLNVVGCNIIKAAIVVNKNLLESGLTGITSNEPQGGSLAISGLVQLSIGDQVSVYLTSITTQKWTVLPGSTFFIQLLSSFSTVQAFQAALVTNITVPTLPILTILRNWRTDRSVVFQDRAGFSPSLGTFCASCDGIFKVAANIIAEINSSTNCTVYLVDSKGVAVAEASTSKTGLSTFSIRGLFRLSKGDCIDFRVNSTSAQITVLSASGFSVIFATPTNTALIAASYQLNAPAQVLKTAGLHDVVWRTAGSSFQSPPGSLNTGSIYTVPFTGSYFVSSVVNFKASSANQSESVRLVIILNRSSGSTTGDASMTSLTSLPGMTSFPVIGHLSVSGVLMLTKGTKLSVCIHKGNNHTMSLSSGLLSVAMVTKDWPGLSVALNKSQILSGTEWTQLRNWKSGNYHGNGIFSIKSSFDSSSGTYAVPLDGVYFVSCNAIFSGSGGTPLAVMIAVDRKLDTGSGLYSRQEVTKRHVTLHVAGSIRLRQGQQLSIFTRMEAGGGWTVLETTGFSVVFNGGGMAKIPGSFAVKASTQRHTTSGWKEITGWTTGGAGVPDTVYISGGRWNTPNSRYTVEESGIYVVTANLILSYNGASEMRAKVVPDNLYSKNIASQNFYRASSVSSMSQFTLTVSGSLSLVAGQNLSVFVSSSTAITWELLPGSSFSVVLISAVTDQYSAGINLFKTGKDWPSTTGVFNIIRWTDRPQSHATGLYSSRLSITNKSGKQYVEIAETGFYYAQIYVPIIPSADTEYTLSVCVNEMYVGSPVTAVKTQEGAVNEDFGMAAFGVLYLTKGQKISPCSLGGHASYRVDKNGGFSLARIIPRVSYPGYRQVLSSRLTTPTWTSAGSSSYYNRGFQASLDSAPLVGTYLMTLTPKAYDVTSNAPVCIGERRCMECSYFSHAGTFAWSNTLQQSSKFFPCGATAERVVYRSAQYLPKASKATTIVRYLPTFRYSPNNHVTLQGWTDKEGVNKPTISVPLEGLYLVSLNLALTIQSRTNTTSDLTFNASGDSTGSIPGLGFRYSGTTNTGILIGLTSLVRLKAGEALHFSAMLTISPGISADWGTKGNISTLTVALVTPTTSVQGFAVKIKEERELRLPSGSLWSSIGGWVAVQIGLSSAHSSVTDGMFVANEGGIYIVAIHLSIYAYRGGNCTLELMVSSDGDVTNSNGLWTSMPVSSGGSYVPLALTSTVRLTKWQAVYPMIRLSSPREVAIRRDSAFYVVLLDKEDRYYRGCNNTGPCITHHPPLYTRLAADVMSVNWTCAALSSSDVTYRWLKNYQEFSLGANLAISDVTTAAAGQYLCIAVSDSVSVGSRMATLAVFDTTPKFQESHYKKVVAEMTEPGTEILLLRFSALDKQERATDVFLNITSGDEGGIFALTPSVSTSHAALILSRPLDFEQEATHQLIIMATNTVTQRYSNVSVTVNVTNVNDHAPVFNKRFLDLDVPENTTMGTTIYQAHATDADKSPGGHVTYRVISRNFPDVFVINSTSGNLTVNRSLDREGNSSFVLTIVASDGRYEGCMVLLVNILDVNDNYPVFVPQNYTEVISEDAWVGQPVLQASAVDIDSGSNAQIVYSIVRGGDSFSIDKMTGVISVAKLLDFESIKKHNLRIQARDRGNPTLESRDHAYVTISVTDANDNNPIFIANSYAFSKPENITFGSVVGRVSATDDDSDMNGQIMYSIPDKNAQKTFTVNASSGEITTVTTLNRETESGYSFVVMATDGGLSPRIGFTLVKVAVTDINDNSPIFKPQNYSTSASEGTSVGSTVTCVRAEDADLGTNAAITYHILEGNSNGAFRILQDGSIVLNKTLDRESIDRYILILDAKDRGRPQLTSRDHAFVNIAIVDTNDNYPEFNASRYSVNITENTKSGSQVLVVYATDQDIGSNAAILYSMDPANENIINEFFSINATTGWIKTKKDLDFESNMQIFKFRIVAKDKGIPSLFSSALVVVMVIDINDNYPSFVDLPSNTSIRENSPSNATILIAHALDADSGSNGQVVYGISKLTDSDGIPIFNQSIIGIDPSSGRIFTLKSLDRENIHVYHLTVNACDMGSRILCTQGNVTIIVQDENDHSPQLNIPLQVNITENEPVNTTIFIANATELDAGFNAEIIFAITKVTAGDNNFSNASKFGIDNHTGRFYTMEVLDRENIDRYQVTIEARDTGNPPRRTAKSAAIFIDDVNDNSPRCAQRSFKVNVPFTDEITGILNVNATDADEGINSVINYDLDVLNVTGGDSECQDKFVISSNGSISNTEALKEPCTYELLVEMSDRGKHSLHGSCQVTLKISVKGDTDTSKSKGLSSEQQAVVIGVLVPVFILGIAVTWIVCSKCRQRSSDRDSKHNSKNIVYNDGNSGVELQSVQELDESCTNQGCNNI